jgi:hypothetical protein
MLDFLLVFPITRQIVCKEPLFVKSRHIRNGIINAIARSPQNEPRASGVPITYSNELAYMGWRTNAYGPVEITF